MTTTRVVIITIGVLGLLTASAPATSYTFNSSYGDWDTATNWTPNGTPGSGDTVTIPDDKICTVSTDDQAAEDVIVEDGGFLLVIGKTLTIGDELEVQDGGTAAATNKDSTIFAEVIDIQTGGKLGIEAGKFVLGINATSTTSNVDGTVHFKKSGNFTGSLQVRYYVTFEGAGTLTGEADHGYTGKIERYSVYTGMSQTVYGRGIILDDTVVVKGTMQLDVEIQINANAAVAVDDADDTLTVGEAAEMHLLPFWMSGAGEFQVSAGKMIFKAIRFSATTPSWEITGGELQLVDVLDSYFTGLSTEVNLSGGTLNIDENFGTSGDFDYSGGTITVKSGKTATFE